MSCPPALRTSAACSSGTHPDRGGPEALIGAVGERRAALGPACDPAGAGESWKLAKAALLAVPAEGLIEVEDHLAGLLLQQGGLLARRIGARRLAPFAPLTANASERMDETALAYLRRRGNSVEMAAELHVHPQTARYRIARLRELLGDHLDDPDARFELEIALRAASPSFRCALCGHRPQKAHRNESQRLRLRGRVRKTTSQIGEETP